MTEIKQKGWWGRNWPWVVPVGCLTPIVLLVGGVMLIISIATGAMKSSDAYKQALARAKADPEVIAALGTPIQESGSVNGSINVENSTGTASMSIPISGSNGSGTIFLEASQQNDQWTYSRLIVDLDNSDQDINLLD